MKRYLFLLFILAAPVISFAQEAPDSASPVTVVSALDSVEAGYVEPVINSQDKRQDGSENYLDDEEEVFQHEKRTVSDSVLKSLLSDPVLKYKKNQEVSEQAPKQSVNADKYIIAFFQFLYKARIFFLVLCMVALLIILIWFLDRNRMLVLRPSQKNNVAATVKNIELWEAADYRIRISEASQAGNLKEAIRWWYLYTLYNLNYKKFITLSEEKTNNEYIKNLRSTPYYKQFVSLTLNYEYIWYGGFTIDDKRFQHIRQSFSDFNQIIEGES